MELKNCPEEVISCKECRKPLMHVWQFVVADEVTDKIVAECPFCGGKSFIKEFKGLFNYGPIPQGSPKSAATVIDDIIQPDSSLPKEDQIWIFKVKARNGPTKTRN